MNLHRFDPADDNGFAALLAIYRESIEVSEQKTAAELRSITRDPRYLVLIAERDGTTTGFGIVFLSTRPAFWLLEYMAIAPSHRSRGLGADLFRSIAMLASAEVDGPGLLEVDQPGAAVSPGNDVARRLAFYRRLGCRRIEGLSYILPLDVAGPPPAMQILTYGIPPLSEVARDTVRLWLRTLYTEVYGQRPDDRRLTAMVAGLPAVIPVSGDIERRV